MALMKMEIEQLDNGATIKCGKADSDFFDVRVVSMDRDKERVVGEQIWEEICNVVDLEEYEKVVIHFEVVEVKS